MIPWKLKLNFNNQEGAAAVEFAIVLPLLMLLIFGVIEFGLLLYNQQVITNAVREGCRTGVVMREAPRTVSTEDQLIKDLTENFAQNLLITFGSDTFDAGDVTITRQDPVNLKFGTDLTVGANFSYNFLFLSTIGIGPINLKPVSTMKME